MPPKRKAGAGARKEATDSESDVPPKKKPCHRPKKNGPYKMPPPLPAGEVLTDILKHPWVLGDSVGKGGFGEIYRAAPAGKSASAQHADHVIKIEPQENGPLFTELAFYCRAAKAEMIDSWVSTHHLSYLAIPKYISQGMHTHRGLSYRFLVMQCFGEDIYKKFKELRRPFGIKTVCHLALRLLEALEFLHESGYAHGDIKGSNLLTGRHPAHQHEVYLVDYGLAYRFCPDGRHKEYKEDPRRKHDGTLEFTSIDAHKGVTPAPRGDLEILGYCLLQWAAGKLPWEDSLNKDYVAKQKMSFKSNVEHLMEACFTHSPAHKCLKDYMSYVFSLGYQQTPDYGRMQQMFLKELTSRKLKDDGKDLDWIISGKKRKLAAEEPDDGSPLKKDKPGPSSNGKQKSKPPSSEPKKGQSAAKSTTVKRKAKLPSSATAAVATDERHISSSSDDASPLLPQVSYPAELGYSSSVSLQEKVPAARRPRATRKPQPVKKKSPNSLSGSKGVSPAKRLPRRVPQQKQRVPDSDSEEEWSPVKRRKKT